MFCSLFKEKYFLDGQFSEKVITYTIQVELHEKKTLKR